MTDTSIIIKDNYSPLELQTRQTEIMTLACALLDPEHLADLLIDRSYGHIGRALGTLLSAAFDLRQQQVDAEELDPGDLEKINSVDAEFAFRALVQHFSDEVMHDIVKKSMLAAQYGGDNAAE